jgi:hypothetical protein
MFAEFLQNNINNQNMSQVNSIDDDIIAFLNTRRKGRKRTRIRNGLQHGMIICGVSKYFLDGIIILRF